MGSVLAFSSQEIELVRSTFRFGPSFGGFFLGWSMLLLPAAKVFSLHSNFFDLGISLSLLYQIVAVGDWQLAFAGHAHWFALLFGELYGLFPLGLAPYFLVSMQAIFLLLPALWFYRRFGFFVAFVYLLYCPVWFNSHFDFHFDHLAAPLLLGFYFALLERRIVWAILSATLLIFVKEIFALQTAACGALLLCAAYHGKSIWGQQQGQISQRWLVIGGVWLICVGLGYFYIALKYLLPYFSPINWENPLGGHAFGWLGQDLRQIFLTIVTEPHVIFQSIVSTPGKLIYLSVVFGTLAFISLLYPVFLVPALPLLALAMLSRGSNHYDFNTHYTAGLIIPVVFAFGYGLPRAEKIWEKLILYVMNMIQSLCNFIPLSLALFPQGGKLGLFVRKSFIFSTPGVRRRLFYVLLFGWVFFGHIMLSTSPISRLFWLDKIWSHSWQAYMPTERDAMMKAALEEFIPHDPKVSVTTQNNLNYSHLAHRNVYLPFPTGTAEPHNVMDWSNRTLQGFMVFVRTGQKPTAITHDHYADYVVLDLKRPFFLLDRGCEWIYGECRNKEMEKKFLDWVAYTWSVYDTILERDGFMILRRRGV